MSPTAPLVVLAILCGSPVGPSDPPSAWVDRLAEPASRSEAIDALEAAGPTALPALRLAASGGGEVGRLASDLIRRIGARRLLRATPVTLDLADRPVPEAIAALSRAAGLAIDPRMPRGAAFSAETVTLKTPGPIGFLEALDRLGSAAGFRQDASSSWSPGFEAMAGNGTPGGRIRLGPIGPGPAPTVYAGPYRVTLLGLHRSRTVAQVAPPQRPGVVEDFRALLEVTAEPGLLILPNGPTRVLEATDERGRELRPLPSGAADPAGGELFPWGQDRVGAFLVPLPMALPDDRPERIERLRGFVPIVAMARSDELMSAPFADLEGKTLKGGGVALAFANVSADPQAIALDLTIRGEPPPATLGFAAGPRQATQAILSPPFNPVDHLRIEDAEGRAFPVTATPTAPPLADGAMTFRVTCPGFGPSPARLRYFAVAAVATEVPFDFAALPIP